MTFEETNNYRFQLILGLLRTFFNRIKMVWNFDKRGQSETRYKKASTKSAVSLTSQLISLDYQYWSLTIANTKLVHLTLVTTSTAQKVRKVFTLNYLIRRIEQATTWISSHVADLQWVTVAVLRKQSSR